MTTTPTAALVEEAEKMAVRALDGTASREEKSVLFASLASALRRAEAERDELRATVTRLNRRAQTAEAGVRDNVEACKAAGVSMGRTLANAAADMYLRRAEKAEAERDAQHALVLRLTGELEALATKTGDVEWREDAAVKVVKMRGRQIAELTATRDLLTAENARLQKEVATLELLRRGGK